MLSAMVVAHPAHLSSSARWIREASSNPNVVGVKIHPVLGDYDILDCSVMRLMEDHIGPSGLTVLSHVGNESPNVPIEKYLKLAARFPKSGLSRRTWVLASWARAARRRTHGCRALRRTFGSTWARCERSAEEQWKLCWK